MAKIWSRRNPTKNWFERGINCGKILCIFENKYREQVSEIKVEWIFSKDAEKNAPIANGGKRCL